MSEKNRNDIKEKNYFRSLDQLAETEEFKQFVEREFPVGASEMNNAWSRRNFLTLMGASVALAGLAGCRRPKEHIVPYVKPPEEIIPGIPQSYATTMSLGTSSYGIVVESHEGRPTKIEGNKLHPSSKGSANSWMLASVLNLYDPDRSQKVLNKKVEKTWEDFSAEWKKLYDGFIANKGEGLAVISSSYASPTLKAQQEQFEKVFPKGIWANYEPVSDINIFEGLKKATGRDIRPLYDYSKANVILSLDADFVATESESVTASKGFAAGRNLEDENSSMNRLYVAETSFSSTGAIADHRFPLRYREISRFALAVASLVGVDVSAPQLEPEQMKWASAVADDLLANKGNSLIVAGRDQSPQIHSLVYAINKELGNIGNAVSYVEPKYLSDITKDRLFDINFALGKDQVDTLIIIDCNPAYDAPSDYRMSLMIRKAKNKIHFGQFNDETGKLCDWHIPMAHFLESWEDAESADGTVSVVQPLIAPLFDSKMKVEFVNTLLSGADSSGYEIVRERWQKIIDGSFEKGWRKVLHDGLLSGSQAKNRDDSYDKALIKKVAELINSSGLQDQKIDLLFKLSPSVYDGRFANNGWLQEMPDAVTRISWDNVAQMSPKTAESYGFKNFDLITLKNTNGTEVEMPVWVVPGTAENSIILELGYGRKELGRIADKAGFNVYPLRNSHDESNMTYADVVGTGRTYSLANVQDHGSMEGRAIVREASLEEYKHHPDFAPHMVHHQPLASMWDEKKYDTGYQWGMTIDLTACTGCNACVIACQSENNVPIIGKEEVTNGREMHWIRLDRYFVADKDDYTDSSKVEMVHQPVACHHCELAPCEQVCPVAATVHDDEGLNTMVYNRCIGTRYCSNNCPYKVRRFNFFNFTKETPEIVKMAMNPDVTVRSRGVMEKCTYCVQRINRAKIEAKKEDRTIRDGEVVVACQQACPADAIKFGNILDENSEIAKSKKRNRSYNMLEELNVRPRTSYLAKIRNKNPKLEQHA